jgi:hypothetical protein
MSLKSTQVYKSFDQAKLGFDGLVVRHGTMSSIGKCVKMKMILDMISLAQVPNSFFTE